MELDYIKVGDYLLPAITLCQSKNNYAEFDLPALLFELREGFR
jgi:hypothetical protein